MFLQFIFDFIKNNQNWKSVSFHFGQLNIIILYENALETEIVMKN